MAIFPCERHGARYVGPQSTLYFGVGTETDIDRVKLRVCSPCLDDIEASVVGLFDQVVREGEPLADFQHSMECVRCNAIGDTVPLFVTIYRPKHDQNQFYARMCSGCAAEWRSVNIDPEPPTPPKKR